MKKEYNETQEMMDFYTIDTILNGYGVRSYHRELEEAISYFSKPLPLRPLLKTMKHVVCCLGQCEITGLKFTPLYDDLLITVYINSDEEKRKEVSKSFGKWWVEREDLDRVYVN